MKAKLIETQDFKINAEVLEDAIILHGEVFSRWSKSLRNTVTGIIKGFAARSEVPILACHPANDPFNRKFILQVGGVQDHQRKNPKGEVYTFYRFSSLD